VVAPEMTDQKARAPVIKNRPADHEFVVLAFGESPFLRECVGSLKKQTVPSRITIATSTPNDFIFEVAADTGLDVLVNPTRAGIAADWNFALGLTESRLVTLAHQDDVYHPDFLARTLAALAQEDGVLCFTGYQEIADDGAPRSSNISRVKHLIEWLVLGRKTRVSGRRLKCFLSFGNPLPCPAVTYDTRKLPGFQFSSEFSSNLDWDAWWRLMSAGAAFVRVPERLVFRRHNDLTETSRLLRSGVRRSEDKLMFSRAWPRPVSDLIARFYRLAG